ncbi:hypothetical protein ABIA35_008479 [Catenulispora sp. MAP12-49]|uniref:hypothetical protein n=1 Tax=Catenulispora sp. MAP12-49 TaxID=3156302 RepID=UPI003519C25B
MQDDRDGVQGFLGAAEAGHDAGPFGCYRIDQDGAAIGTIAPPVSHHRPLRRRSASQY